MGKHKHRRRERDVEYVQPMNDGYNMGMNMNSAAMNGNNQYMPNMQNGMNMNQQMNPNMNSNLGMMNNPLMGLLGGLNGGNGMPDMNGLLQVLNGFGLGIDPSMANLFGGNAASNTGGLDIMQMLGGLLGGNMSNSSGDQNQGYSQSHQGASYNEVLDKINPEQMQIIEGILQGLGINSSTVQGVQSSKVEKQDDGLEQILASLDFNSILNNFSNDSFLGLNFNNADGQIFDEINLSDVINNSELDDEGVGEIRDADIVEENIINVEKELSKEEYKKLINVLIKLIDPNKIRLLQKVFNEYEKRMEIK